MINLWLWMSEAPCCPAQALVEEGKIKYIGLSEVGTDDLRKAHKVHPITAVQLEWSLWTRDAEVGFLLASHILHPAHAAAACCSAARTGFMCIRSPDITHPHVPACAAGPCEQPHLCRDLF